MELTVGAILEGKVKSITNFGAFIALPENKTGMVHISDVANTFVNDIHDHLTEGQTVKVKNGPVVSPPPKTGDNTMLWLYGGVFTAAMSALFAFVIKEFLRRRRQAREDAEMFA